MNEALKKTLIGMAAGAFGLTMVGCGGSSAEPAAEAEATSTEGGEAAAGQASCGGEAGKSEEGAAPAEGEGGESSEGEHSCGSGSCGGKQ